MVCLICLRKVFEVLVNNRCVLLKKNISLGLFRLFILGRKVNRFVSIYIRKVENIVGCNVWFLNFSNEMMF